MLSQIGIWGCVAIPGASAVQCSSLVVDGRGDGVEEGYEKRRVVAYSHRT